MSFCPLPLICMFERLRDPTSAWQGSLPPSCHEGQDTSVNIPETKYTWNGDAALAYQTLGEGPIDIILQLGFASHLDQNWTSPHLSRFLLRLGRHGRLIVSDRRGLGLSERYAPTEVPPL